MQRWAAAAAFVLGCGEIREVPVDDATSTSTSESTSTAESTSTSSSTSSGEPPSSTTQDCNEECDTETHAPTTSSTTDQVEERTRVCWNEGAEVVAGDRGGASATITIEPGLAVIDVDVLVRISHEHPRSIRIQLARDGMAPIDLLDDDEGDDACGVNLDVRFDDEADTPASELCTQVGGPYVVAPAMPIAELLGDDAAGVWTLTAIVPSAAASDGTLTDACLSLLL